MIHATSSSAPNAADNAAETIVSSVLQEISHIATLPEVTLRIIQLVEDPNSTAQDLNKVISNDPALGARILKVVNSAFYGLPGQIGSINRAIVLLGLHAVKNIAIAASLAKLFRGGKICSNFDARELWSGSIASATATRILAGKIGLGLPDEAFLAGLIHDIGIMVEIQTRRPKFVEIIQKLEADPALTLRDAELEVFGTTHEYFGAALCRLWKFPTSFANVTGFHHRPHELSPNHRSLTSLVHVADVITFKLGIGFTRGIEQTEIDPVILTELNLTQDTVDQIMAEVPHAIEETKSIFQIASE